MRLFFVFFIIFFTSSCVSEDSGSKKVPKKEMMESWAWKIFVFTDEGEIKPAKPIRNEFHDLMNAKLAAVDNVWKKKK